MLLVEGRSLASSCSKGNWPLPRQSTPAPPNPLNLEQLLQREAHPHIVQGRALVEVFHDDLLLGRAILLGLVYCSGWNIAEGSHTASGSQTAAEATHTAPPVVGT